MKPKNGKKQKTTSFMRIGNGIEKDPRAQKDAPHPGQREMHLSQLFQNAHAFVQCIAVISYVIGMTQTEPNVPPHNPHDQEQ
mmetsp:Transcript_53290/g.79167  ORF Transcript_53290/g.79167 Transcript_53290/m.79167 type:complete len:82 (-) Transcript_53290:813-1058(-)